MKRYDPVQDPALAYAGYGQMRPDEDGDYVLYEDALKEINELKEQRENWRASSVCRELKAENEMLRHQLNNTKENNETI